MFSHKFDQSLLIKYAVKVAVRRKQEVNIIILCGKYENELRNCDNEKLLAMNIINSTVPPP